MTNEDELKIRAQAEARALSLILQFTINQFVAAAGEAGVLEAKIAESSAPQESPIAG